MTNYGQNIHGQIYKYEHASQPPVDHHRSNDIIEFQVVFYANITKTFFVIPLPYSNSFNIFESQDVQNLLTLKSNCWQYTSVHQST